MKSPVRRVYAALLVLLSGTLVASNMAPNRSAEPLRAPLDSISKELVGWKMAAREELSPRQLTATSYLARTYIKDDGQLGLLIAHHDSHQAGVSVHTPKNCLPGDGWEIWKAESVNVVYDGRPVAVNQYHVSKNDQRMIVLYWYQSRNRVIASDFFAKLMLVRDALIEGRTSGSFVRIVMADNPKVVSEGLRFAEAVMPQVQRCFRP
jgi:EpsI family protein